MQNDSKSVTLMPFPRIGNFIIYINFQQTLTGKTVSTFYFGMEEVDITKYKTCSEKCSSAVNSSNKRKKCSFSKPS